LGRRYRLPRLNQSGDFIKRELRALSTRRRIGAATSTRRRKAAKGIPSGPAQELFVARMEALMESMEVGEMREVSTLPQKALM
jgi:Arc/MetJ-type ribon-helix-helix transcriptional regulator